MIDLSGSVLTSIWRGRSLSKRTKSERSRPNYGYDRPFKHEFLNVTVSSKCKPLRVRRIRRNAHVCKCRNVCNVCNCHFCSGSFHNFTFHSEFTCEMKCEMAERFHCEITNPGWLLQLRGQLQKSHTEEAVLCVRPWGDRRPRPDEHRPTRLGGGAVGHSQCWHAASHLPGGVYAGVEILGWLLQGCGPLLLSHTDSGRPCVRSKERRASEQRLASASHRGTDLLPQPFGEREARNPTRVCNG